MITIVPKDNLILS